MFQSTTNAYRLVDTGAQQTSLKKKDKIGGDMKRTMFSTQSPLLILIKPTLVMNVQYTLFIQTQIYMRSHIVSLSLQILQL